MRAEKIKLFENDNFGILRENNSKNGKRIKTVRDKFSTFSTFETVEN